MLVLIATEAFRLIGPLLLKHYIVKTRFKMAVSDAEFGLSQITTANSGQVEFQLGPKGIKLEEKGGMLIVKLPSDVHLASKSIYKVHTQLYLTKSPPNAVFWVTNLMETRLAYNIYIETMVVHMDFKGELIILIRNQGGKCVTLSRGANICALVPAEIKNIKLSCTKFSASLLDTSPSSSSSQSSDDQEEEEEKWTGGKGA